MTFPVSSPSEQGVDPQAVQAFLDAAESIADAELHGLIIHRHGQRIAEGYWAPHTAGRERLVYSLSKTVTSTALALQVGEGRLGLDDLVADHLPELFIDAAAITRRMRIRHIASMTSGHDHDMVLDAQAADRADPLRGFFSLAPTHEPGSYFAYNQPPVLALAVILQRLAGQPLTEYLRPRLAEPIGMGPLSWQQYQGFDIGFSGAHTSLDAVARLGQLYLDDGRWDGRSVLPAGWVAQASHTTIPTPNEPQPDWRRGYGFLLWGARHGYRGDGAYGQFMIVLPDQDAVIAIFAGTENMQAVLDAVWAHLLPAMGDSPLASGSADLALADRLRSLTLPTAVERTRGSSAPSVHQTLRPAPDQTDGQSTLTSVELEGGSVVLREGDRSIRAELSPGWTIAEPDFVAASAAQDPDGRIAIDLILLDTPHRLAVTADPTTGTFTSRWDTRPLRFAGTVERLTEMHRPTHGPTGG